MATVEHLEAIAPAALISWDTSALLALLSLLFFENYRNPGLYL